MSIVLEGKIKYKKGKKWKIRFCVLLQVSDKSGLELYIGKDPADFHFSQALLQSNESLLNDGTCLYPAVGKKLSISSESTCSTTISITPHSNSLVSPVDPLAGSRCSPARAGVVASQSTLQGSPSPNDGSVGRTSFLPSAQAYTPSGYVDNIYGFESGRHVDKERCVVVLIGISTVHCMALQSIDEMFRWADVLERYLQDTNVHVSLVKTFDGSRLNSNTPGILHVQPGRLCLIAEPAQGNKFICAWSIADIESYSFDNNGFQLNASKASGKGRGTHHFAMDKTSIEKFRGPFLKMRDAYLRQQNGTVVSESPSRTRGGALEEASYRKMTNVSEPYRVVQKQRRSSDAFPTGMQCPTNPNNVYMNLRPTTSHSAEVQRHAGVSVWSPQSALNTTTTTNTSANNTNNTVYDARKPPSGKTPPVQVHLNANSRDCGAEDIFPTDEDFEQQARCDVVTNPTARIHSSNRENRTSQYLTNQQRCSTDTTAASSGFSDAERSLQDPTSGSYLMSPLSDVALIVNGSTTMFTYGSTSLPCGSTRPNLMSRSLDDRDLLYCLGVGTNTAESWWRCGGVGGGVALPVSSSQHTNSGKESATGEKLHCFYRRSNSVSIRHPNTMVKERTAWRRSGKNSFPRQGFVSTKGCSPCSGAVVPLGVPKWSSEDLWRYAGLWRSNSDSCLYHCNSQHARMLAQANILSPIKENQAMNANILLARRNGHDKLGVPTGADVRPRKVSPPILGGPALGGIREEAPTAHSLRERSGPRCCLHVATEKLNSGQNYVNCYSAPRTLDSRPHRSATEPSTGHHSYMNMHRSHGGEVAVEVRVNSVRSGPQTLSNNELPDEVRYPRMNYALVDMSSQAPPSSSRPPSLHHWQSNAPPAGAGTGGGAGVNYAHLISRGVSTDSESSSSVPVHGNYAMVTVSGGGGQSHTGSNVFMMSRHMGSVSRAVPIPSNGIAPQLNYASIDVVKTKALGEMMFIEGRASHALLEVGGGEDSLVRGAMPPPLPPSTTSSSSSSSTVFSKLSKLSILPRRKSDFTTSTE